MISGVRGIFILYDDVVGTGGKYPRDYSDDVGHDSVGTRRRHHYYYRAFHIVCNRVTGVSIGRVITIGAILVAVWALLYYLWRFLKRKKQNTGRRTVDAEYRVKG